MIRQLVVPDALHELIRHLPPEVKRRLRAALEDLVQDPTSGKPLREELEGFWSYPVGRTRIIYRLQEPLVILVTIGPRKTIYRDVAILLKQQIERRRRE